MPRTFKAGLNEWAFMRMHDGSKKMEFRLRRGKWRSLKAGDFIEFRNDAITGLGLRVKVLAVVNYPNFSVLLDDFNPRIYTCKSKGTKLKALGRYYTAQEVRKFTVLGIRVKVVKVLYFK